MLRRVALENCGLEGGEMGRSKLPPFEDLGLKVSEVSEELDSTLSRQKSAKPNIEQASS